VMNSARMGSEWIHHLDQATGPPIESNVCATWTPRVPDRADQDDQPYMHPDPM
jgi:hypothetical protein